MISITIHTQEFLEGIFYRWRIWGSSTNFADNDILVEGWDVLLMTIHSILMLIWIMIPNPGICNGICSMVGYIGSVATILQEQLP